MSCDRRCGLMRALPWLRRRRAALALLAVPALLLRAFLPVGFMPVAATDGWIGFCPGAGALPPALAASAAPHHHHDHHSQDAGAGGAPDDPSPAHHAPCLFAAGSFPAFSPAVLGFAPPSRAAVRHLLAAQAHTVAVASIERAQSARAPPALT
jgi:hypothetical protein